MSDVSNDTDAKPSASTKLSSPKSNDDTSKVGYKPRTQRKGRSNRPTRSYLSAAPKFKGAEEKLDGNVYQCAGEQGRKANQFNKTTEVMKHHANKMLPSPQLIESVFTDLREVPLIEPADLANSVTSRMRIFKWELSVKEYNKNKITMKEMKFTIWSLIWGQCSELLKTKLKSLSDYDAQDTEKGCGWLLTQISRICQKVEHNMHPYVTMLNLRKKLYNQRQREDQNLLDHAEEIQALGKTNDDMDGGIGLRHDCSLGPEIIKMYENKMSLEFDSTDVTDVASFTTWSNDQLLAMIFLMNSDHKKYGDLTSKLHNDFLLGTNNYPASFTEAFSLLLNYEIPSKKNIYLKQDSPTPTHQDEQVTGANFAQKNKNLVRVNDGKIHEDVECYKCHAIGHYATQCTEPERGLQSFQFDISFFPVCPASHDTTPQANFNQIEFGNRYKTIKPEMMQLKDVILLDTGSTVHLFMNESMLTDIKESDKELHLETNGGTNVSNLVGFFDDIQVWYNELAIANVFSYSLLTKRFRVVSDSYFSSSIFVFWEDKGWMEFLSLGCGLYAFDVTKKLNSNSPKFISYSFIQTVKDNKNMFSTRQIKRADEVRKLYPKVGRPGIQAFRDILDENLLINCPYTSENDKIAEAIYGQDVSTIRGRNLRQSQQKVPALMPIHIDSALKELHKNVRLFADVFWVNGLPFLLTVSENIGLFSSALLPNREKETLQQFLNQVFLFYKKYGFSIDYLDVDLEFKCVKDDLQPNVNLYDKNSHVHPAERAIRTVKERVRCSIQDMPFSCLPTILAEAIVNKNVSLLNDFPRKTGISKHLSPITIVSGAPKPDFNLLQLALGEYVEVFEDNALGTNSPNSRGTPAITLNRFRSTVSSYNFLSLITGKSLTRSVCTPLPMPSWVIERVDDMGSAQNRPWLEVRKSFFHPITDDTAPDFLEYVHDDDSDPDYVPDDDSSDNGMSNWITTPHSLIDEVQRSDHHSGATEVPPGFEPATSLEEPVIPTAAPIAAPEGYGPRRSNRIAGKTPEFTIGQETNLIQKDTTSNTEFSTQKDVKFNVSSTHINLFQRAIDKTKLHDTSFADYSETFDSTKNSHILREKVRNSLLTGETSELQQHLVGMLFNQMSSKAGIKKHGEKAEQALYNEFLQLYDMDVFIPIRKSNLSKEQMKRSLRAISVIKEKRDGILKGRVCADGRKQRDWYPKHETVSPTVHTDSFMLTTAIEAKEKRDTATADIKGAYLHATQDDFTVIKFVDDQVDIMCRIDEAFREYVVDEGGHKALYLVLNKALYGTVKVPLLWYNLLTSTLVQYGFKLNPYDLCVANAIINKKQCTIIWHVDDTKISHVDSAVVDDIIRLLEDKFDKMKVVRGDRHEFLGQIITFKKNGTFDLDMSSYLREAVEEFGEIMELAVTPARSDLFTIDYTQPLVDDRRKKLFHRLVYKLLYCSCRGHKDLQVAISFLTQRVEGCNEGDYNKFLRLMHYVYATMDEIVTIGIEDIGLMRTFVDASYAVHDNMRSNTGGAITFGIGVFCSASEKQKINTKSSTEAELVAVSEFLPKILYVELFLEAQGYPLKENILYQDNQSAIKLELNDRKSSGKRTRHINIRYFFVKDLVDQKKITIEYCQTHKMIADFFTKPLQGRLFRALRAVILGRISVFEFMNNHPNMSASKERVGI